MRIMVFSNWMPPIATGSSFYAESLARSLAEQGHEICVVTLDWGGALRPATQDLFPVHTLPVKRVPKMAAFYGMELMGFSWFPSNLRNLDELIRRFRPDLIHHVNHIFDSIFLTEQAARRRHIPLVGSITTPIQHQNPRIQRLLQSADRWTIGRFGVAKWDGIVSLDSEVHQYVARIYGNAAKSRSTVIPFGPRSDGAAFYDAIPEERASTPLILFIGQMHPFRNPTQLVKAMPLVLETIPSARLLLVGRQDIDEPKRAARELGLLDSGVEMPGELSHERIVKLMKEAHVYAGWLTGPFRNLGTAPMEAMLCDLPVVSDVPEDLFGPDTVRHDRELVLVDSRSTRSIADGLIRALTDQELRRKVIEGGRRLIKETLSWQKIAIRMEAFYREIVHTRDS